jgi:hypothetical protein
MSKTTKVWVLVEYAPDGGRNIHGVWRSRESAKETVTLGPDEPQYAPWVDFPTYSECNAPATAGSMGPDRNASLFFLQECDLHE